MTKTHKDATFTGRYRPSPHFVEMNSRQKARETHMKILQIPIPEKADFQSQKSLADWLNDLAKAMKPIDQLQLNDGSVSVFIRAVNNLQHPATDYDYSLPSGGYEKSEEEDADSRLDGLWIMRIRVSRIDLDKGDEADIIHFYWNDFTDDSGRVAQLKMTLMLELIRKRRTQPASFPVEMLTFLGIVSRQE